MHRYGSVWLYNTHTLLNKWIHYSCPGTALCLLQYFPFRCIRINYGKYTWWIIMNKFDKQMQKIKIQNVYRHITCTYRVYVLLDTQRTTSLQVQNSKLVAYISRSLPLNLHHISTMASTLYINSSRFAGRWACVRGVCARWWSHASGLFALD